MPSDQVYVAAFAQVIKGLREAQGLTQEELASRAGIHVVNISKIENAKALPLTISLFKLSAAFKVSTSELIRRVEQILRKK